MRGGEGVRGGGVHLIPCLVLHRFWQLMRLPLNRARDIVQQFQAKFRYLLACWGGSHTAVVFVVQVGCHPQANPGIVNGGVTLERTRKTIR